MIPETGLAMFINRRNGQLLQAAEGADPLNQKWWVKGAEIIGPSDDHPDAGLSTLYVAKKKWARGIFR